MVETMDMENIDKKLTDIAWKIHDDLRETVERHIKQHEKEMTLEKMPWLKEGEHGKCGLNMVLEVFNEIESLREMFKSLAENKNEVKMNVSDN